MTSEVENLARLLYCMFSVWDFNRSGVQKPKWENLRRDLQEGFLSLAERLTLEER